MLGSSVSSALIQTRFRNRRRAGFRVFAGLSVGGCRAGVESSQFGVEVGFDSFGERARIVFGVSVGSWSAGRNCWNRRRSGFETSLRPSVLDIGFGGHAVGADVEPAVAVDAAPSGAVRLPPAGWEPIVGLLSSAMVTAR
ncbi:hypothetical protein AB0C34_18960 [Nocardia sp. NPDC049220]|uniref:hypothetical protein n=1 Tax=Nocardia sp. NPDC049220 TaxID=3155273 RepID=UPI0033E9F663